MTRSSTTEVIDRPDWQLYPALELHPILEASLGEFQRHGYHGTTVRGIAKGAELTMPSLYYHYGNKEGILSALLDIALDDWEAHVTSSLRAAHDTIEKFENFIMSVAMHYTNRRDLAVLHHESRFLGDDLRNRYLERRRGVDLVLEEVLAEGIEQGIFVDEDLHFTVRVLLGMLGGILDWYRKEGPLSPIEISERYVRDACRLVLKDPTPRRSAGH